VLVLRGGSGNALWRNTHHRTVNSLCATQVDPQVGSFDRCSLRTSGKPNQPVTLVD